jgi:3-oxoacyl-[acyl-carrier protein] reductase
MSSSADRSIGGKTALITGAASGMGRACAELFAREGANVVATDVDEPALAEVVDRIAAAGGRAIALRLDAACPEDIAAAVAKSVERFGGIDIVLNIGGIGALGRIDAEDYDELWDRMIAIHLTGHQRIVRAALPHLRRSASPRVVNFASTDGLAATRNNSQYVAAKSGAIGLTRALAVDLGRDGITVNCICPGPIETGMTRSLKAEDKAAFAKRRTALGRYGAPEEVADVALSLCLPSATYVTGAIIPVDGGLSARGG